MEQDKDLKVEEEKSPPSSEAPESAEKEADEQEDEPVSSAAEPDSSTKSKVRERKRSKGSSALKEGVVSAVELRGVTKIFGKTVAVHELSFKIPEGCVYGLIGPNGAGKTTTFSMMAGYLKPSAGDVYLLDYEADSVSMLKGKIGVLPQDALLPANENVGEFLLYLAQLQGIPREVARKQAGEVLEEVDGSGWWNTKCRALSHGMAKRVGLAQALLGNPKVVLLDEPTAGLDPKIAFGVRKIVKSRKGKCTLVISSHNLQELEEICDRALIMDHGQMVAEGSISDLTASTQEVRFELARGAVPLEAVRAIEGVKIVNFDKPTREMAVEFDKNVADAEEIIRRVFFVLIEKKARVSGVYKGRGLEQRVMELTE
jgi:ABC-2 type transport system ATP-binding protein